MKKKLLLLFFCTYSLNLLSLKLDRVILATDNNPLYIQFWPLAAQLWQEIIGVRPTLALIAEDDVYVDQTIGDVLRFKPIPGVPNSLYAQCIRILLPCLFPDDVCIVSDIDLLPLQKKFFTHYIKNIPDDCFTIYRDHNYWFFKKRIYMNYNAAKGSVFREIFGITSSEEIPIRISAWNDLGIGWATDEKLLYAYVHQWHLYNKKRLKKLGFWPNRNKRVSRKEDLHYQMDKLNKGYYVELNCPRPYEKYKIRIDAIVKLALSAHRKQYGQK